MKTKTKTIASYTVPERKETIYIASDGTEFNNKNACQKYEIAISEKRINNSIKVKFIHSNELFDFYEWKFIENEEQLEFFINKFSSYSHTTIDGEVNRTLKIGSWINYEFHEGGDYYPDRYIVYTLEYVIDVMSNALRNMKGILNES